ncbi:MAG TPA: 16S rRNA (cytosine(1402)-N(4))-methyltransferase RsmH [Chloroflexota bacterium]|nr:16S rRNA (cytosine(1402)-N(4))-methyltransferase RsmH [Chloroflexota bacterium]
MVHTPVMVDDVLEFLAPRSGGAYVDGTVGAAGHAEAILRQSNPDSRLLGLDADPRILEIAAKRLADFGGRVVLVNENFARLERTARWHGFFPADGILLDLGVSSLQLDSAERGFSFQSSGPLDMRLGPSSPETASQLVNQMEEKDLADLIFRYGEEPRSRAIARAIVAERRSRPIETTDRLADIVRRVVPPGKTHPATRTFQALRIAVNRELESLETGLQAAVEILAVNGRLVVISFHSLEDRIVKQFFAAGANPCICPPRLPYCVCQRKPTLEVLTRRVIMPSPEEISRNPRARSAKLRAARKLDVGGSANS